MRSKHQRNRDVIAYRRLRWSYQRHVPNEYDEIKGWTLRAAVCVSTRIRTLEAGVVEVACSNLCDVWPRLCMTLNKSPISTKPLRGSTHRNEKKICSIKCPENETARLLGLDFRHEALPLKMPHTLGAI